MVSAASRIEVRVRLNQSRYGELVRRLWFAALGKGERETLTAEGCHQAHFREQYGEWLGVLSADVDAICDGVRVEGCAGQQRYYVATFAQADRKCAMLFKLTWNGV